MRKSIKRLIVLLVTAAMLFGTSVVSSAKSISKHLRNDNSKLLFMYIGDCGWVNSGYSWAGDGFKPYTDDNGIYVPYTKSELDKLSNVNGYVLCHAEGVSYENYKTTYIPYVINSIKTIISSNPNAKIWFATPTTNFYHDELGYQVQNIPSRDEYKTFLKDVKKAVTSNNELGISTWENNIIGVYYCDEDAYPVARENPEEQTFMCDGTDGVPRYFTGHWQEYSSPFDFVRETGEITHDFEIKYMWCPFYGIGGYGTRLQQIYDADIFDNIIIQPSYYWSWFELTTDDLQRLHSWIINQNIDGITSRKTELGLQMEVDENAIIDAETRARYNTTVDVFKDVVGKHMCSYYAGASPALEHEEITNSINNFYNENISAKDSFINTPAGY